MNRIFSLATFLLLALPHSARADTLVGSCTLTPSTGALVCAAGVSGDIWLESTTSGMTAGVDMTGYTKVVVTSTITNGSGWLLNIGDSETNNGYCGDAGSTSNDAEFFVIGKAAYLCRSDIGNSGYVWRDTAALNSSDSLVVTIADGSISYYAASKGSGSQKTYAAADSFQLGGNEEDREAGRNDTNLWIGLNRVISGPSGRTGSGISGVVVSFYQ